MVNLQGMPLTAHAGVILLRPRPSASVTIVVTGVGEGAVKIVASVDGVPGSSAITARFPFPNGAGSYSINGTFNTDPSTFSGTVTLVQASRLAGALTGSATGTLLSSDGSRNRDRTQ